MGESSQQMMGALAAEFEQIRPLYEEHLRANRELLPHVLMADITTVLAEPATKERRVHDENSFIRRLVARLEEFWAAEPNDGDSASNVIAVSFLENFRGLEKLRPYLCKYMGEFADVCLAPQPNLVRRSDGVWVRKDESEAGVNGA